MLSAAVQKLFIILTLIFQGIPLLVGGAVVAVTAVLAKMHINMQGFC